MPSENVQPSGDRRTRKRDARRGLLLDLALDLVDRDGVDGLTMTALAEAADYAPASLYTYFESRSALLAALQRRALRTLADVVDQERGSWTRARLSPEEVAATDDADALASLAALVAFSELFLSAPRHHPREFRLQQQLLAAPGAEDTADAATVVPDAMAVMDVPRTLLETAVERGAIQDGPSTPDPLGIPLEAAVIRSFAWVAALNGALMVDNLSTGLPATGHLLGASLTDSLLAGWGASAGDLVVARRVARRWADTASPVETGSPVVGSLTDAMEGARS